MFLVGAWSDAPFGLPTSPEPEGELTARWRALQSDIANDLSVIHLCRAALARCPSRVAPRFIAIIDEGLAVSGRARVGVINRGVNLAIGYMSDERTHGVPEYWAPPLAVLEVGGGDCMDYAIMKYTVLMEAGVVADDVGLCSCLTVLYETRMRSPQRGLMDDG